MPITKFPNGISSFGSIVYGGSTPAMGREFYVRKTSDSGYAAWKEDMDYPVRGGGNSVHTTITSALAAANDFDTIWVYPGQWTEAGTLAITQSFLRLLAVQAGPNKALTKTEINQYGGTEVANISIESASNVEIAGFRITPYASSSGVGIEVAQDSASYSYGSYIHDNFFYNVEQEEMSTALRLGRTSATAADCTHIYIANNDFFAGGTRATSGIIDWNLATRGVVIGNTFSQIGNNTDYYGIKISNEDAPRGWIRDNMFFGTEVGVSDQVCIGIYAPAAFVGGDFFIDGNHFVNYADDDSCISSNIDEALGLNYHNEDVIAGS